MFLAAGSYPFAHCEVSSYPLLIILTKENNKKKLLNQLEECLQANLNLVQTVDKQFNEDEKNVMLYHIIKNLNEMTTSILKDNLFVKS